MRRIENGAESLLADVSVLLGGAEVAVTKQFLDNTQVCTTVEKVGRKRVTERVRTSWLSRPMIDDPSDIARSESPTPPIDEDSVIRGLVRSELVTATVEP